MIIGLCGPEGAGKTSAALMLAADHGLVIRPFAGPLKAMLKVMGVPDRNLHGSPEDKEAPLDILGGKSARYALQRLGTEWGRGLICDDIWVRSWASSVPDDGCVVDDVRFPNEVAAIRSRGGIIICIVRSLDALHRTPKHASENFAALDADHIIVNDSSKGLLRDKLRATTHLIAIREPA